MKNCKRLSVGYLHFGGASKWWPKLWMWIEKGNCFLGILKLLSDGQTGSGHQQSKLRDWQTKASSFLLYPGWYRPEEALAALLPWLQGWLPPSAPGSSLRGSCTNAHCTLPAGPGSSTDACMLAQVQCQTQGSICKTRSHAGKEPPTRKFHSVRSGIVAC